MLPRLGPYWRATKGSIARFIHGLIICKNGNMKKKYRWPKTQKAKTNWAYIRMLPSCSSRYSVKRDVHARCGSIRLSSCRLAWSTPLDYMQVCSKHHQHTGKSPAIGFDLVYNDSLRGREGATSVRHIPHQLALSERGCYCP